MMDDSQDRAVGVRVLHGGRYLSLMQRDRWEYVTRVNATDVVAIVAVHDDQRLVLVEQYRPPVGRRVIELPAGLVGDELQGSMVEGDVSEGGLEAAQRELLEETGYEATSWSELFTGISSGGLTDESVRFFHATGLRRVGAGGGVGREEITVHEIPCCELMPWLRAQREAGKVFDAKLLAGVYAATFVP